MNILFKHRPIFYIEGATYAFRFAEMITFHRESTEKLFMCEFNFKDLNISVDNYDTILEGLCQQLQNYVNVVITSKFLVWNNGNRISIYVTIGERINVSSDLQTNVVPVHKKDKTIERPGSSRLRAQRFRQGCERRKVLALVKQEKSIDNLKNETIDINKSGPSVLFKSAPAPGELKLQSFNGKQILQPVIFVSTGTDPVEVATVSETATVSEKIVHVEEVVSRNYVEGKFNKEIVEYKYPNRPYQEEKFYMLNRLAVNEIYERVRKVLAFFGTNKQICYNGDTYLSLMTTLHNDGVKVNEQELRSLYYEFFELRGVSKIDVDNDLSMYSANIATHRMLHLTAAAAVARDLYEPGKIKTVMVRQNECILM